MLRLEHLMQYTDDSPSPLVDNLLIMDRKDQLGRLGNIVKA